MDRWIELGVLGATLLSPILHVLGLASQPWARTILSLLPDVVGAVRRAQGKAGAPGAPNVAGL
jgi:hypothetical protein